MASHFYVRKRHTCAIPPVERLSDSTSSPEPQTCCTKAMRASHAQAAAPLPIVPEPVPHLCLGVAITGRDISCLPLSVERRSV